MLQRFRLTQYVFSCILVWLSVLSINSCKKADSVSIEKTSLEIAKMNNPENAFLLPANSSSVLQRIVKELERQNIQTGFIKDFVNKEGFPIWDKSRTAYVKRNGSAQSLDGDSGSDTIVYIPLVVTAQQYVHGFLKATVGDSVDIRIYRQNDYADFPFQASISSTPGVTTAENFAARMMGMDRDVFGTTEFKVTDNRMFHNGTNYSDTGNIDLYIKLVGIGGDGGFASFGSTGNNLAMETCLSGSSWWLVPCFAGSSNNTTPGYCYEVHTWNICISWEIGGAGGWPFTSGGGGGGGTPGGGNNPCSPFGNRIVNGFAPPIECNPGPGGNPWPPIPPVVQTLQTLLTLNPVQIDWLTHHLTAANEIRTYLQVNNGSTQIATDHLDKMINDNSYFVFSNNHHDSGDPSKMWWADASYLIPYGGISFGTWAIDYITQNPSIPFTVFKNQFMGIPEGQDGTYDQNYWNDPTLTFPPQTLPTWASFNAAFPKHDDPLLDEPEEMYTSVGGQLLTMYLNDPDAFENTCALRVSKALNYSGVTIPAGTDRFRGADGKYYFVSARALLIWMKKTFGTPTGSNHLTGAQGGANGQNFPTLLAGKKGIYMLVPNYPAMFASGHADMIDNGVCDGSCYFNTVGGGISEIFIWELP